MALRAPLTPPRPHSVDDSLPFRFVGGDVSLDLVNTVDWTSRGPERDRVGSYSRLVEWALAAEVLDGPEAARLRERAATRSDEAADAYAGAMAFRWTLKRLVGAIAEGSRDGTAARAALDDLNWFIAESFHHARLELPPGGAARPQWTWERDPERLDTLVWPIVRSAAELIASTDASRLRVCPGPDCGWVYVDRSRNGLRRWCEMSTCGTDEKSRRRRERTK